MSVIQSSLIAEYMRYKATHREVALYAFVEEMAASGGYLLACAADSILVSK
jgi:serine protease SohB